MTDPEPYTLPKTHQGHSAPSYGSSKAFVVNWNWTDFYRHVGLLWKLPHLIKHLSASPLLPQRSWNEDIVTIYRAALHNGQTESSFLKDCFLHLKHPEKEWCSGTRKTEKRFNILNSFCIALFTDHYKSGFLNFSQAKMSLVFKGVLYDLPRYLSKSLLRRKAWRIEPTYTKLYC